MKIPPSVAVEVERLLGARIVGQLPIAGGCINHGTRVDLDGGETMFLKWQDQGAAGVFEAEAEGLRALRAVPGVRAPEPRACGERWLLLDYVPTAPATRGTASGLGRMLAALHAATGPSFGWPRDNWIGSLPQANAATATWAEFWRDRRLAPQLARARAQGHLHDNLFDTVLDVVDDALADVRDPELLHGDLWGGNWLTTTGGDPVFIDPAVHHGHGEVDLAMSELFGGFEQAFYDAYRDARDVTLDHQREYRAFRRDLYQLYYLMVHVNLFGASYEAGARAAAGRVVAELAG